MKVHIYRGQNQIGGSIVEISTANTRIILDIGIELDEKDDAQPPSIDGLFNGQASVDAVFVSHYHSDHVGLFPKLLKGIPIYIGKKAFEVMSASYDYREIPINIDPIFFVEEQMISIGDITITPIKCDHSAFDSYMFLVSNNDQNILYTGDFRANGRENFERLLEKLPQVDALIIEGTTLSRETAMDNIEEEMLEDIAVKYLENRKGPVFLMLSAMNIDRIETGFNIAHRTHRLFLEDIYTAGIAKASGCVDIEPSKKNGVRAFLTKGGDFEYEKLQIYGNAKIGIKQIAKSSFVMCVRQSMEGYLKKLNESMPFEDGTLFYAMWKGYMEQPKLKAFLEWIKARGVKIHILHTSGHADEHTIEKLIAVVSPKCIIPIHTENPLWFDKYTNNTKIIYNENDININDY